MSGHLSLGVLEVVVVSTLNVRLSVVMPQGLCNTPEPFVRTFCVQIPTVSDQQLSAPNRSDLPLRHKAFKKNDPLIGVLLRKKFHESRLQ
jgi:hypothetical protein